MIIRYLRIRCFPQYVCNSNSREAQTGMWNKDSAVDARRPTLLLAYNGCQWRCKEHLTLTKSTKREPLYAWTTWKGTASEERAGRQHRGMLGRALCLLPLECPRASYIRALGPTAAPSATFTVSSHTRLSDSKARIHFFAPRRRVVKCCNYGLM